MFPHTDTIYAVFEMRRQEELQFAARQRLAATAMPATAMPATRSRLTRLAARGRLYLAMHRIGALLTHGTTTLRPSSPMPRGR